MIPNLDSSMILLASMINLGVQLVVLYYTHRTEKNTNSMKDALVKATGEAHFAEGREVGREEMKP